MSIDDIVQLTIVVSSATLSRPGFGTPLGLINKAPAGWGADKVRTFSKLAELTDLGFTSADPGYKLAQKIKSQSPAPSKFKLALRGAARKTSQSINLTCLDATEGATYSIEVGVGGGAKTLIEYTVPAAATTTTVAAAIEALIEAVTGVNSAPALAVITVTPANAAELVNLAAWTSNFSIQDMTSDPGVEDDLDDVLEVDQDWYGVLLDSNSENEVKAAAAWTEANKKLFGYSTSDTGVASSGVTTDVCSDLKALGYDRTFGIYNANELLCFAGAAWMARGFAFDPGKITWAFKDLAGVAVDKLSTGVQTALEAKNCNFYVAKFGRSITWEGKLASGEYIDVTHGLDWLEAEMAIQVFQAVSSLPKLPYTKSGLGVLEGTVKAVMKAATRQGVLADDENLYVRMPTLDEIDPVTRAQRLVPNIEFGGRLAGAIHKTKADGLITN